MCIVIYISIEYIFNIYYYTITLVDFKQTINTTFTYLFIIITCNLINVHIIIFKHILENYIHIFHTNNTE